MNAVERVLRPLERMLRIEALSGLVLVVAALVALVWANSRLSASYEGVWNAPVRLGLERYIATRSVRFWINDGLMVVFFFVVGLEIRREIQGGELADGVLTLLGKRVPAAVRILLLTLAVVDDIGAIVVIALFYSSGVSVGGLVLGVAGVAGSLLLQRLGARRAIAYVVPGLVVWLGCLRAGIHPAIAGVILGLVTPAGASFGERDVLADASDQAVAPAVRLQSMLHPWVAFVIMPLFALANAGVNFGGVDPGNVETRPIVIGVALGLVVGKPVGVMAMSYLAVRLRLAVVPAHIGWRGVGVVGGVAGVGFTMAIFIAGLAFAGSPMLGAAKVAILVGSGVSGVAAMLAGAMLFRGAPRPKGAVIAS